MKLALSLLLLCAGVVVAAEMTQAQMAKRIEDLEAENADLKGLRRSGACASSHRRSPLRFAYLEGEFIENDRRTSTSHSTSSHAPAPCPKHFYDHENDYMFIECMALCALIPGVLFFEFFSEKYKEFTAGSDAESEGHDGTGEIHGHFEEDEGLFLNSNMNTSHMWETMRNRVNDELMVLGFLAFVVWCGTQGELWQEFVPPKMGRGQKSPRTYHELLEVVEDVHMHLFIAMILHFIVIFVVIFNATYLQHVFENLEVFQAASAAKRKGEAWEGFPLEALAPGYDGLAMSLEDRRIPAQLAGLPTSCCGNFFLQLTLRMTCYDLQDVINVLRSYCKNYCFKHADLIKMEHEGKHFDFGLYMRLSLDEMLHLIIHFSAWCWVVIFIFYAGIGILANYLPAGDNIEYIVMGVSATLIFFFFPMQQIVLARIHWFMKDFTDRHSNGETTIPSNSAVQSVPTLLLGNTKFLCIVAQSLTFLNCYAVARIVGAKRFWKGNMYESGTGAEAFVAVYVLSYVLNGLFFLPRWLPWAAILLSIPPFMEQGDFDRLNSVLVHRPDGITVDIGAKLLSRRSKTYVEENDAATDGQLERFLTANVSTAEPSRATKVKTYVWNAVQSMRRSVGLTVELE